MRPLLLATSLAWLVAPAPANAGGGWFESDCISYWGDACRRADTPAALPAEEKEEVTSIRDADALPFSWDAYRDPANLVYWDDGGEWQPSRPFMELVRDPTAENMRKYRRWTEDKAQVAADLQRLLALDVAVTGPRIPSPVLDVNMESELDQVVRDPTPAMDWGQVRIVYFYQSSCPHCQRSVAVVDALERFGATVLPVFLDAASPEHPGSVPYDERMRGVFRVEATPTWVVQVGGQRGAIEGYATVAQLREQVQGLIALQGAR